MTKSHTINENVYIYDIETILVDGELKAYAFGAMDLLFAENMLKVGSLQTGRCRS